MLAKVVLEGPFPSVLAVEELVGKTHVVSMMGRTSEGVIDAALAVVNEHGTFRAECIVRLP